MPQQNLQSWPKDQLIDEILRLRKRKKYGLVWEEKFEDVVEQCKKDLPVLKEVKNKAIIKDADAPINILIEGDNYHTLSVLNYTHNGKVDVIYIDPPYNTGNKDFVYNDHYVDSEDPYRHSKWLSFIGRRIKLAKNLLKQNGAIFISINENELAQLKLLCDEIFGERNYLTTFTIKVRHEDRILKGDKDFHEVVEYLLLYRKSAAFKPLKRTREDKGLEDYIYEVRLLTQSPRKVLMGKKLVEIFKPGQYEIAEIEPSEKGLKNISIRGSIKEGNSSGRFYMRHIDSFAQVHKNHLLMVPEIGDDWLGFRYFLTPKSKEHINGTYFQGVPLTRIGNNEKPYPNFFDFINEFNNVGYEGNVDFRNGKKPIAFIEKLLEIANFASRKEAIMLDFFAGSGSAGHAILDFNRNYNQSHRFILCTNNENNIATDVCYPRIAKVMKGYANGKGGRIQGLGGNLKYFRTAFVDAEPNDKNKEALTRQATEMLCMREDTFESVKETAAVKIFKNAKQYTGIVFDESAIPALKKEVGRIGGTWSVYVFSLGDDTFEEEFEDMMEKVTVSPIPEAILRVYRRLFAP